eukprot:6194153-Pleurochrysis_carterae.AAC.11
MSLCKRSRQTPSTKHQMLMLWSFFLNRSLAIIRIAENASTWLMNVFRARMRTEVLLHRLFCAKGLRRVALQMTARWCVEAFRRRTGLQASSRKRESHRADVTNDWRRTKALRAPSESTWPQRAFLLARAGYCVRGGASGVRETSPLPLRCALQVRHLF